ncbi:MAG TPA: HAMP domain-containing sensor histidine kinase [Oligoflexia bacterium]|nr:HAMP domain-containing sensor histidine kinase [Oligoflexia bacterium]HMR24460.1 HAMP domain-containing sensor histidine kinase [Oligoflexia bacterium]
MKTLMTKTLRARLFIYYLVPIAVLLTGSSWYFYSVAKKSLDYEMNLRLIHLGETLSQQIDALQIKALQDLGESSKTHLRLHKRLAQIVESNDLAYMYLIDAEGNSLVDSRPGYKLGVKYVGLDIFQKRISNALAGEASTENLYVSDLGSIQKYAFVPIINQGQVQSVIVLKADVLFFASLNILRKSLSYFTFICLLMIVVVSSIVSSRIVKPIEKLVRKAKEIGEGVLSNPIKIKADGELQYLANALEDMRCKIKQRDQERDMMLKGIAHEIKNPIGGIDLYVDILSSDLKNADNLKSVEKIGKETAAMKRVVDEFLDFARGIVLDVGEHDVDGFLLRCSESFERELKEKKIVMQVNPHGYKWTFDQHYIKRVVLNLMRNALDAVEPEKGKIVVDSKLEKNTLYITIEDNGKGILKQNLNEIYKPFFTSKAQGMGLGLAFCKKIIEKHGGIIDIQSEYEEGTVVKVSLPKHG